MRPSRNPAILLRSGVEFGHRIVGDRRHEAARLEDVSGAGLRVDALELLVVLRPEEDERCRQRAGADAGDDGELRPIAARAPAGEQAGAVGAVVAAARDGEERPLRGLPLASSRSPAALARL